MRAPSSSPTNTTLEEIKRGYLSLVIDFGFRPRFLSEKDIVNLKRFQEFCDKHELCPLVSLEALFKKRAPKRLFPFTSHLRSEAALKIYRLARDERRYSFGYLDKAAITFSARVVTRVLEDLGMLRRARQLSKNKDPQSIVLLTIKNLSRWWIAADLRLMQILSNDDETRTLLGVDQALIHLVEKNNLRDQLRRIIDGWYRN